MRQKKVILTRSPENLTSKLPESIRLYINSPSENREIGDKLIYTDGAIPFLITTYNNAITKNINQDFSDFYTQIVVNKEKVSKEYILKNFWVYRIGDYSNQVLSPGFSEIFPLCFYNDGTKKGYKLPQDKILIIRNYTTKEVFVFLKKVGITPPSLNIIVDFKNESSLRNSQTFILTRENGKFSFNMKDKNINSLDEINLFVREGTTDFLIQNSEYFFNISTPNFAKKDSSEFVSQQKEYFNFIQNKNTSLTKNFHDIDIIINDNFKNINQLILKNIRRNTSYYFERYQNLRNIEFNNDLINFSIYKYDTTQVACTRLIPGINFYIDSTKKISINGANDSDIFEVIIRTDNDNILSIGFQVPVDNNEYYFSIKKALHENYVAKWNINLPFTENDLNNTTRVFIFKNGLLDSFLDRSAYTNGGIYEYLLESIDYKDNDNSDIPTDDNTVSLLTTSNTFDTFNKYQITTDPYLNTFEQVGTADFSPQEVYLYEKSLGFKIDDDEPYVDNTLGVIEIQGITDPYPSFLSGVEDYYETIQKNNNDDENILLKDFRNASNIQAIETQISNLKKNYSDIIGNSTIPYSNYTAGGTVVAGRFLFLILKGTNGNKFDLVYKKTDNSVIKKEYNCTFNNDLYISIPFFLDTFKNETTSINFEITRGTVSEYYIFR